MRDEKYSTFLDEMFSFLGDIEITCNIREEPDDEEIPFCDMDCSDCDVCGDLCQDCEFSEYPYFWGIPDIERIIFNKPATIVIWADGTKTVVKCMADQPFEKYAGFAAACMKKLFGSTSRAKAVMEECAVPEKESEDGTSEA